jgi:hypothetical protein
LKYHDKRNNISQTYHHVTDLIKCNTDEVKTKILL